MKMKGKIFKKVCFLIAIWWGLVLCIHTQAPEWEWAVTPEHQSGQGNGIAVDNQGNVYATGGFNNTISFGATQLISTGGEDIFIAKMNSQRQWLWARKAGGTGSDCANAIAVDSQGNIYITGVFSGTAIFGDTELRSFGNWDAFIAKLSSEGQWMWAKSIGATGPVHSHGIDIDRSGNVYVTGHFSFPATIAAFGNIPVNSYGPTTVFVAKLNGEGEWQWAQGAGPAFSRDIAVDREGSAYITGGFSNTANFGTSVLQSYESRDVFVAKINENGVWEFAVSAATSSYAEGRAISVDRNGNCYVTGRFSGIAEFGWTELQTIDAQIGNTFIAQLDARGVWGWAKSISSDNSMQAGGVCTDHEGNIYIVGGYRGQATVGEIDLQSTGYSDIYTAKIDRFGEWIWAVNGGGGNNIRSYDVTADRAGNLYVTGMYRHAATFGNNLLPQKNGAVFLARLGSFVYHPPGTAVNPYPPSNSTGVTVNLTELKWEYIADGIANDPIGFRVYFGDNINFDPEDFQWVPYEGDRIEFSCTTVLPAALDYNTGYYWQVVPTANPANTQAVVTEQCYVSEGKNLPVYNNVLLGDAENCPVWFFITEPMTSVNEPMSQDVTRLHRNYPNPFNPNTRIELNLQQRTVVTLNIYNSAGFRVRNLYKDYLEAGMHQFHWNGKDDLGQAVSSGIYFYRVTTDHYAATKRMLLLK